MYFSNCLNVDNNDHQDSKKQCSWQTNTAFVVYIWVQISNIHIVTKMFRYIIIMVLQSEEDSSNRIWTVSMAVRTFLFHIILLLHKCSHIYDTLGDWRESNTFWGWSARPKMYKKVIFACIDDIIVIVLQKMIPWL